MINFYLLVVAVVASGVIAVLRQDSEGVRIPSGAGTVLLWVLCITGWLYFLKLIRLRQAWHESASAMTQIKKFYIDNVDGFHSHTYRQAFLWKDSTLPPPHKPWNVFFYSAMLIGFLDSVAFMIGGSLIYGLDKVNFNTIFNLYPGLLGLGVIFLAPRTALLRISKTAPQVLLTYYRK